MSAAEDPEKILDQAVEDMQRDLIRLRQGAAEVTASQKRMQNKASLAQTTAVSERASRGACAAALRCLHAPARVHWTLRIAERGSRAGMRGGGPRTQSAAGSGRGARASGRQALGPL